MTNTALTTHDLGNNESYSTGAHRGPDGWVALTGVESKTFKTEAGAVRWLARRGYRADGSRLSAPLEAR